jgi:hypothetical protein
MTAINMSKRPSVTARRGSYTAALLTNTVMLYLINGWPGWQAVPFLTDDTEKVIGLVNASIVASLVVNAMYLGYDGRWFKHLGDMTLATFGMLVAVRMWTVFPFAFAASGLDWSLVVRALLVVAIVGSGIGIVANAVPLVFHPARKQV